MNYYKKLPDELIARIIQLGQVDTDVAWDYGKATIEVQAHLLSSGLDASLLESSRLVCRISGETRSLQSIYRYAMVAKFYSDKNIDEYLVHPIPFSHFAYAMRYKEKWNEILDYCLSFIEEYGCPPSLAKLNEHFNPSSDINLFLPDTNTESLPKEIPLGENTKILKAVSESDYYSEESIIIATQQFEGILSNSLDNIRATNPKLAQALSAILVMCKNILNSYYFSKNRSKNYIDISENIML